MSKSSAGSCAQELADGLPLGRVDQRGVVAEMRVSLEDGRAEAHLQLVEDELAHLRALRFLEPGDEVGRVDRRAAEPNELARPFRADRRAA